MRTNTLFKCLLWVGVGTMALAAPLEPRDHWATDAVRKLSDMGLIEGYPQSGFKGDRAVSRWEAATLLARALAKIQSKEATLANKADRAVLVTLLDNFREELDALGVHVTNLEDKVQQLDERVDELSRITFSGRVITRYWSQDFANRGLALGAINYDNAVGSIGGSNFLPYGRNGILPVIDLARGRPLTNGQSFTSTLYLDANIRLDEEWSGLARFYAYSAQGNPTVDAVWGVTPPYLANTFTGRPPFRGGSDPQGLAHSGTQMGLDRFSITNDVHKITLTGGTFQTKYISNLVYLGQANPQWGNPRVLESFGFHLTGENDPFQWEVFGAQLPDGTVGVTDIYHSYALGGALKWNSPENNLSIGLSFLRASNQGAGGNPVTVGQITTVQSTPGALYTDWVNPPGFYVNQQGGPNHRFVAGSGSTSDVRPIPGLRNSDALNGNATFGPQGITLGAISAEWNPDPFKVYADYAISDYRPNRNADYNSKGKLWRIGLDTKIDEDRLVLSLDYRSTDPNYDPMVMEYPGTAAGVGLFRVYYRLPDWNQFWFNYNLHNTNSFPHNRQGLWAKATWRYDPDGVLTVGYRNLQQVQTSLQDIRVRANTLGGRSPLVDVLGHSPGFWDAVFREYSPLSFRPDFTPLEDERGRVTSYSASISHVFTGSPWRIDAGYDEWNFRRPTSLSPQLGGSVNNVDLHSSVARVSVGRSIGEDVLITLGYQQARTAGHYDPAGVYNTFAISNNSTDFYNWDTVQHIPSVELSWGVADGVNFSAIYRKYYTKDRIGTSVYPNNNPNIPAHPFNFDGQQFGTTLEFEL